jgi:S-layer protein (TIGR01564 family)
VKISLTNDTTEVDQIAVSTGVTMTPDKNGDYKYGVTAAGTYVKEDVDNEVVTLFTPEEPSAVYVAVGADPEFVAGGVSGGTVLQAVQIKNSISKLESEIDTAALTRDLVLIGGPCANGLVAELLEMSSASGTCSTEFLALYPTEGVITVESNAFDSGQKALVVAGKDRAATRTLAVKVMQGTVEYDA